MDKRTHFHQMMQGHTPEWLPLNITATPPVYDQIRQRFGNDNLAEIFDLDFEDINLPCPNNEQAWRDAYAQLGVNIPKDADIITDGAVRRRPPAHTLGDACHLREWMYAISIVTSVQQLEKLPFNDYAQWASQANEAVQTSIEQIHAAGRVSVACVGCTTFEPSWYMRGMDTVFLDLAEGNGISDWLLDYFTNRSLQICSLAARHGCDVIVLGDDIGTQRGMMMSPDYWRQHLKPRLVQVINAIRENQSGHTYIYYHSDGDIRAVIADLIEIGIDILNPVQPECMPIGEVIPAYQDRVAFWGMIGTQTTMPFGTTDDVQAAVAELAELAKNGARLIIAPTHVLEPDVPMANIEALVDAVRSATLEPDSPSSCVRSH